MSQYYVLLLDENYRNIKNLSEAFWAKGISYEYFPKLEPFNLDNSECIFIVCNIALYADLELQIQTEEELGSIPTQCLYIFVYGDHSDIDDIEVALYRFADDYFFLPVSPKLIMAKFNALSRRHDIYQTHLASKTHCISNDHLIIDPSTKKMLLKGQLVALTLTEFNIIYTLASNPQKTYSMDYLFTLITGQKSLGDYNAIMTHISRMRKKIAAVDPHKKYILTVRNQGYRFNDKIITPIPIEANSTSKMA
ncbi:response regulator transcription factor [Fusibacter paucivorans]|uniref:Response regulator transcription factor n=1 Tax=Fusibacter paucivorans TaxID=76009 RepID=A0ABS5PNV2_9FIRM|nr:response regulator transcription factor [Fusibacter paucivorans]MBS7526054.1 response regulator transcription factor [Fusibacter paucivorans]